jgi:hypothetical protein
MTTVAMTVLSFDAAGVRRVVEHMTAALPATPGHVQDAVRRATAARKDRDPTSGVLADDFSDLLLFWPGSRFGADSHITDVTLFSPAETRP